MNTILVIDDIPDNVELIKFNLEEDGYKVYGATTAATGLDLVSQVNPDIILLDFLMPEMDGLEFCEVLKIDEVHSQIPIIMITAESEEAVIVKCLDSGAHDFVSKPIQWNVLGARVRSAIRVSSFQKTIQQQSKEIQLFTNMATHDLQEPLKSVVSIVALIEEMLKEEKVESKEIFECLHLLKSSTGRMSNLVKDIMQLAKTGNSTSSFKVSSLRDIIEGSIANVTDSVQKKKATINVDCVHDVWCKPGLVQQLIQNLLSNSLKFTKKEIIPEISITSSIIDNGFVQIKLTDNGIGIDPKNQDKVFKPFFRLNSRSKFDGTGIGLALCDKILKLHHSQIKIDSQLGSGTSFTFNLPTNS